MRPAYRGQPGYRYGRPCKFFEKRRIFEKGKKCIPDNKKVLDIASKIDYYRNIRNGEGNEIKMHKKGHGAKAP